MKRTKYFICCPDTKVANAVAAAVAAYAVASWFIRNGNVFEVRPPFNTFVKRLKCHIQMKICTNKQRKAN